MEEAAKGGVGWGLRRKDMRQRPGAGWGRERRESCPRLQLLVPSGSP